METRPPSAFPGIEEPGGGYRGMTLRDYFAGQALIGIAANMNSEMRKKYLDGFADGREGAIAYALADAMLVEREKGGV